MAHHGLMAIRLATVAQTSCRFGGLVRGAGSSLMCYPWPCQFVWIAGRKSLADEPAEGMPKVLLHYGEEQAVYPMPMLPTMVLPWMCAGGQDDGLSMP